MSPSVSARFLQTLSDARLVSLAAAGHERAFEALVRRYRRELLSYSRRLVSSPGRGEDAVQQALLQAWLALLRGAEIRDVKSWLYRIVHNTALNMQRGAAGQEFAQLSPQTRSTEPGPEAWIAVSSLLSELAELPSLQRQALLSSSLDGRSHDEIATALGLSTGAVRGLIYRARTTLRAAARAVIPLPVMNWMLGRASPGPSLEGAERITQLLTAGSGVSAAVGSGAALAGVSALLAGAAALPSAPHVTHHRSSRGLTASALHRAQVVGLTGSRSIDAASRTAVLFTAARPAGLSVAGAAATSFTLRPVRPTPPPASTHDGSARNPGSEAGRGRRGDGGGESGSAPSAAAPVNQQDGGGSASAQGPSGSDGSHSDSGGSGSSAGSGAGGGSGSAGSSGSAGGSGSADGSGAGGGSGSAGGSGSGGSSGADGAASSSPARNSAPDGASPAAPVSGTSGLVGIGAGSAIPSPDSGGGSSSSSGSLSFSSTGSSSSTSSGG